MSDDDRMRVFAFLATRRGQWFAAPEIREGLGLDASVGVERILAQLEEHGRVECHGIKGWRVAPLFESRAEARRG